MTNMSLATYYGLSLVEPLGGKAIIGKQNIAKPTLTPVHCLKLYQLIGPQRGHNYMSTPFRDTLSRDDVWISSARALSSSTSQFAQTNLFLRNTASSDAIHTRKCAGNSTEWCFSIVRSASIRLMA